MTRDELREKVAMTIDTLWNAEITKEEASTSILETIFAALKEPTEEMIDAYCEQRSYEETADKSWKLMLEASPLAPSKETK